MAGLRTLCGRLRAAALALPAGAPRRLFLTVLAGGLLATAFAVDRIRDVGEASEQSRFEASAERLEGSIGRRLNRAEQVLRNAAAASAASGGMDRTSFATYVRTLAEAGQLQPADGMGWVQRVPRDDLGAFVARQRAGAPQFHVHGAAGDADPLVVTFLEPAGPSHPASGRDLGADPVRREAIERAIDTGEVTWTAPLQLVDAPRLGWIAFLAVYRPGPTPRSAAERRSALSGLFFLPLGAADVLRTVRGVQEDGLRFQMHDGPPAHTQLVYDSRTESSAAGPQADVGGRLHDDIVTAGGRALAVRVWSHQHARNGTTMAVGSFAGLALSLFLALAAAGLLRARERAEARSREMQQDLRRMEDLAEHSSGVLLGLDARLRVRWVNAGFTHLTGWSDAHCLDMPVQRLLRAADGGVELAQAADRLRFGAPRVRGELLASRRDGGVCWLDADVHREGDGFLLTAIDITGRREAERRLADNEHLMRLMMDSIDARLSYWDTDLRCRLANRTAARAAGLLPSDMLGRHLPDLLGADWAQLEPRVARALAGEPQRFEWTSTECGAGELVALAHYLPDIDRGLVRGVFAFTIDITELKQAQRAALRANDAKSQFLSHMSHEIRTPINGMLGMLALLRGTALGPRQAEYAGKAETAARSLLGLLNDVLDLTKIEAGSMPLDLLPFRPALLLRDLAAILDGAARPRGLALEFALDPAIPQVLVGDDMRLRQVLVNLGGNAVKFTREGGVAIDVRLLAHDDAHVRLEFAVTDTGIGIALADQERIFRDFSQATAATTREFGGTGLGLGISRRLVAMMGGQLRVESVPGRGSRFWFELTLPIADEHAVPVTPSAPQLGAGEALAGLRLLVVEDNPVNQQVARELLTAQGAHVTVAGDGAHGVRCVETASPPFDAVLMDVQMPVMDGWAAAREIRNRLGDTTTPIIAMTANAMAADRERSLQAGMNEHVAKPFDLPALVDLLRKVTGRNAADASLQAPAPAARPAAPAWSRATALQRLGGQEALLERTLPVFRASLRGTAGKLDALRGDTPPQQAIALFHMLKGMAATMGADVLAEAAAQAEQDARAGTGDTGALASAVRQALAGTLDALDAA